MRISVQWLTRNQITRDVGENDRRHKLATFKKSTIFILNIFNRIYIMSKPRKSKNSTTNVDKKKTNAKKPTPKNDKNPGTMGVEK